MDPSSTTAAPGDCKRSPQPECVDPPRGMLPKKPGTPLPASKQRSERACTMDTACHPSHTPPLPSLALDPTLPSKRPRPGSAEPGDTPPISGRKLAKKRAKRTLRRAHNFVRSSSLAFGDQEANARVRQNAVSRSGAIHVDFDVNALSAAKGGWVGIRKRFSGEKRAYSLDELLAGDPKVGRPGMTLFQWRDR